MRRLAMVLALVAMIQAGCKAASDDRYMRDGMAYGVVHGNFNHRWWNYYERGVSFAEGGFHAEAARDFEAAVAQRAEDAWWARTMGMHLVDYFPHRELGIVHYRQGRYDEAALELERSLNAAPSAKAAYYLNKVRASVIETSGVDTGPPALSLEIPDVGLVTNEPTLDIRGVAEDDTYVAEVYVNGERMPMGLAQRAYEIDAWVELREGINEIGVWADDLMGRRVERTVSVRLDIRGPVIVIEREEYEGGILRVRGYLTDDAGVGFYTMDGRRHEAQGRLELEFSLEARVEAGAPGIEFAAYDVLGNRTFATLGIPEGKATASAPVLLAYDDSVVASDAAPMFALSLRDAIDTDPPFVRLEGLVGYQSVYEERALIEGSASDDTEVRTLRINGEPVLRRGGKRVYFSQLYPLKIGRNEFSIEAVDTRANAGRTLVVVDRKQSSIRRVEERMSVAVLLPERRGTTSVAGDMVYDGLLGAMQGQGRFRLVEREAMQAVLFEHKLVKDGLVDHESAVRAGRLLSAEMVISLSVVESAGGMEVTGRVIDVESGEVVAGSDVYDEDVSVRAVVELMEGLAYKFGREFPMVEGRVADVDKGELLLDKGARSGLGRHMRLIVYREGRKRWNPEIVGEVKVSEVYDQESVARIVKGRGPFSSSDMFITK